MQVKPPRPTGVTILGVLAILVGLAGIAFGGLLILAAGVLSSTNIAASYPQLQGYDVGTIAIFVGVLGAVLLITGILYLATGIGFFGGKGWSWTLGIIVSILSIIVNVAQVFINTANIASSAISIIISLVIIFYLTRPHVKIFFGKAPAIATPMAGTSTGVPSPTMTSSTMGSTMGAGSSMGSMRCPNCGANVPSGSMKCPSCGANL